MGPLGARAMAMANVEWSSNLRWAASKAIETKDTYNNGRAQTHTHTLIYVCIANALKCMAQNKMAAARAAKQQQ